MRLNSPILTTGSSAISVLRGFFQSRNAERAPDPNANYLLLCATLSGNAPASPPLRKALSDRTTVDQLIAFAGREMVLPALHEAVENRFADCVGKWQRVGLATHYEWNRRRNQAIRHAIIEIGAAAQERGFEVIAVKGAIWILEDEAGAAAWRSMLDIDLLVQPENFDIMATVLTELGYAPLRVPQEFFGWRRFGGHFHLVPYRRGEDPFFIEVHRHLGWRPDFLPTELAYETRRRVGCGLALPAPWFAVLHALIHWQVQHDGFHRGFSPLKEILETARWLSRADVNWDVVASHVHGLGLAREVDAAIAFATELMGVCAPSQLKPSERGRAHVARCLRLRVSPARAWLADRRGRLRALLRRDKLGYRSGLRRSINRAQ
jgi:hypothetical protein